MTPITVHTGLVAPFDRSNIDTDQLVPKQFLKKVGRDGFGEHLFDEERWLDAYDEQNPRPRRPDPDFILNQAPWNGASVLLARANFGCGSSREHALWALVDFGIKVVLAPSFSDIFYSNAIKNGLLPVRLAEQEVDALFEQAKQEKQEKSLWVTIDLESQQVIAPPRRTMRFDIDPTHKEALLSGSDEIAMTLRYESDIQAFERARLATTPWL